MASNRTVDVLIVGQGLAGTVAAFHLIQRGKSVLVVDNHHHNCASKVAAGLYNPFVFKWITKSWMADELLPELENTYMAMESMLGAKFFHPTGIERIIASSNEQKQWERKSQRPDVASHIDSNFQPLPVPDKGFGRVQISTAGWLDLRTMLSAFRAYLSENDWLIEESFMHDELHVGSPNVYRDISCSHVLFCEGAGVMNNPFFRDLDWKHTKGEVLDVSMPAPELSRCLNYGQFIVPLGGQQHRTGTTYNWDVLDFEPSEEAREKILRNHEAYFGARPEVKEHRAGVRPTSADRRPFAGKHPSHPSIAILNATGSKGVMLAPWSSRQLVEHLLDGRPLHPEIDVARKIGGDA